MQEKQAAGLFLEIFMVVAILATLLAVAVPRIGQMISKTETVSHETELKTVQAAVIDMLCDSSTRTLQPVGPTADMKEVLTGDTPPLILADYLMTDGGMLSSGCCYSFDINGRVTQNKD